VHCYDTKGSKEMTTHSGSNAKSFFFEVQSLMQPMLQASSSNPSVPQLPLLLPYFVKRLREMFVVP